MLSLLAAYYKGIHPRLTAEAMRAGHPVFDRQDADAFERAVDSLEEAYSERVVENRPYLGVGPFSIETDRETKPRSDPHAL